MRIEINGFAILLQRKRVKNINLRIKQSGEIQLSAPIRMPMDVIHRFLQDKCAWIEMHRSRLQQLEKQRPQHLITGEYLYFQGVRYELQLHDTSTNQRVELNETQLRLFVNADASQAHKELILTKWYRSQMEQCLPALFDKWQSIMGVTVSKITIRRMKSRWGSCHPLKKQITLNLRLIEKPLICLEYVIVHELVHLFEASHNQRFYRLMSHYLPDWKQIKNQLIAF
jgi:predicted metal-dependent hydrolase